MPRHKPIPKQGARGTPRTRRMQRHLADHILRLTNGYSVADGAEVTGLTANDVKNLRVGNMPSLRMLICLVRTLRCTPESLTSRGTLRPLPRSASTRGAQERLVKTRIQRIAKDSSPAELAKKTGLSIASIYQFRTRTVNVGLHSYLAFVTAGCSGSELLLGPGE